MKDGDEDKKAMRKRSKEYYLANREKILQDGRDRYARERELIVEQSRARYAANREKRRKQQREYYYANREKILAQKRESENVNREGKSEYNRAYQSKNPHIIRALANRRRAAKMDRILIDDCELTHFVDREAADLCVERKMQTGFDWHVDHMIPLRGDAVSGLHHWGNLQVIPAGLNHRKSNRMIYTEPFEWLKDA